MLLGSVNFASSNRFQDKGLQPTRNDESTIEVWQRAERQTDPCTKDRVKTINFVINDIGSNYCAKPREYRRPPDPEDTNQKVIACAVTDMRNTCTPITDIGHGRNDGGKHRIEVKVQAEMADQTYCRRQGQKMTSEQLRCHETSRAIGRSGIQTRFGNKERCLHETECESARSSGYISSGSVSSFSRNQSPLRSQEVTPDTQPEVTITTADEYNVYIEPTYFSVTLRKQTKPNANSTFSKTVIQSTELSRGTSHVVTFSLSSDPNYFLTTNRFLCLELKASTDVIPTTPTHTDERLFTLYQSEGGDCFVQPYPYRGCYLHHMDGNLSISKLELNFRPPEEFLFQIIQSPSSSHSTNQSPPSSRGYDQSWQPYQQDDTRMRPVDLHFTSYPAYAMTDIDTNANEVTQFSQNRTRVDNSDTLSPVTNNEYKTSATAHLTDDTGNSTAPYIGEVKLRKSKRNKNNKEKRNSLYNVVAMTGCCFGLGHKA